MYLSIYCSAPDYFDPTTIARHLGDNWALKSSNLRKLVRNLEHYYHEGLQKDADFGAVDMSKIARSADTNEIQGLVFWVAAAAVTCDQKSEYVSRIMTMSADAQGEMKGVLQSSLALLSEYQPADDASDDENNEMVFDEDEEEQDEEDDDHRDNSSSGPKNLFGANHHLKMASEDMERDLAEAKRELAGFRSQAGIQQEDNEKAQSKLRAVVEDLQDRLVKRQDELIQVEEDLQGATSELEETKSKYAEVQEQKAQLADDLDVANAKTQQLYKAEATVVAYKKKLESVGMMNQQMADLEDQSANYLRQIMDLESEVKKSNALQKTVTQLTEQIAKLTKEQENTATSSQSSATEIAGLKSRLNAAESAKKMYEEELSELRAQQEHAVVDVPSPGQENHSMSTSSQVVPADAREKMMRLEIENKKLVEEMEALKKQSSVAETAKSVASLSVDAAPMAVAVAASDSSDVASLKSEIERLQEELGTKEKENAKISGDKDKLEAYTKRTLAKFQDKYLVALQECKAKLKEKQDKIEILETRSASERTAQKREERLLSSTIYELGLAIMQNRLKER
jgi:septal ring factor EnvC (AmiA/AmiB activator)